MRLGPAIRAISVLSALLFSGVFVSCGGGSMSTKSPAKLTLIKIAPSKPALAKGTTMQLVATGVFSDGTEQTLDASLTWQSNKSSVATIDAQGNVTGADEGVALVSASSQGITGSASVTVGLPTLLSIAVSPFQSSLPLGESEQLTATGSFSDGTVQDLTQSATWTPVAPTIASASAQGLVTGVSEGVTQVSADYQGVTGSASITVGVPALLSITLGPNQSSLPLGESEPLTATGNFSYGAPQNLTQSVTWTSSGAAIAVTAQGTVTAQKLGVARVFAVYQGVTGAASVTVGPPALLSITVSANQLSLPKGESEPFAAIGNLSNGTTQNLTQSASWSSSVSTIASVGTGGTVVANAVGTSTISATSASVTGAANLTVTPPVPIALNINPPTLSIVLEGSRQLQAIATMSDGTTQNMTGTAAWSSIEPAIVSVSPGGLVTAQQVGSATILAQSNNLSASASLTVIPLMAVSYFSLIDSVNAGVDGTYRLINPGLTAGNSSAGSLCAMVYVFDQNQEMNECCGCAISDSGLLTLSLLNDLTANTLTGNAPRAGQIKVVPSTPGPNQQCNAASPSPNGVVVGWGTNAQNPSTGASPITEEEFSLVPLYGGEATVMENLCSYIQQLGSGSGICTCGTGG